jgi:hypothetical protein
VEVGEKLPQALLPQVTVHLTPPLLLSLLTTAVRLAVAETTSEVGAEGLNATEIAGGAGEVIVMVVEAALVVSVTEVAVIVTVAGFVGGAVGAV